ncbi:MAG: DnaD domain protein [Cellulosilyticaceae bacterium]
MACITFNHSTTETISVPYWFISDYMPQALGGYVKVYLYLLGAYQNAPESLDLEEAAKTLDMLYSELMAALHYWHEKKVLDFAELDEDSYELTFNFIKPLASNTTRKIQSIQGNVSRMHLQQTRPHYTTDELSLYKKQHQSIANLFIIAEKYLGRLLSNTDQQVLFGLYDWLNMPLDLIEFLVEYCASNNHTHIRYIEKVALSWVDQGITSIEAAQAQTTITQKYRQILKTLGRSGETITKHERDVLDKWLASFDLSLLLEACKRTVLQASSPSLKYVGSILDNWTKNNVKTLEDVEKLDKEYTHQPTSSSNNKKSTPKNKTFTSMYSHNWDLDELETRASDYMEQTLYGGKS